MNESIVAAFSLILGTATPGGGFPVYGAAFVATVQEADPGLTIDARNTKGSAENIPLLEQGKLDLALVQGEAAYEALAGINRPGPTRIRIVWAMYSSPGMFVVRADSPYRRIDDLKGKPIAWGAKGSGLVILGGYVVDGLGLDRDRDFKPIYLDRAGDGPAMVQDGRAAALWGGGIGWPGFTAVATAPGGARFIAPGDREIDRILAKHRFLKPVTIPAGSYPGQVLDIPSVGSWSFVFAREDLPEASAYRVARALHQGEARFAARLVQARESTAANTWAAVADRSQLHPGVARYLRDAGIAR
ncbi:MAG TPA: TAXI family TRAP transporter solute-binding subunit [Usitatibacter sp.]|nr:TAXI family TRAP transporter solute-binding subunit [Usitatibacter sp.]